MVDSVAAGAGGDRGHSPGAACGRCAGPGRTGGAANSLSLCGPVEAACGGVAGGPWHDSFAVDDVAAVPALWALHVADDAGLRGGAVADRHSAAACFASGVFDLYREDVSCGSAAPGREW